MTKTLSVRETVFQLYFYDNSNFKLQIEYQQVSHGLPSSIRYCHSVTYQPSLGVLKIYDKSLRPEYFLTHFLNQETINITSLPQSCPHAPSLLFRNQSI